MVNNCIMFSDDGLLMKDFDFHTVESCKKQILENLPTQKTVTDEMKWIYVSLESQVNMNELTEILEFLREQKIEYHFGAEDEYIPKYIK